MMKDLKHYFTSPKDNFEQLNGENVKEGNLEHEKLNDVNKNILTKEKSKKKKRKRKFSDSDLSLTDVSVVDDVIEPVDKKKRKKSSEILKTKKKIRDSIIVSDEDLSNECPKNYTPINGKRFKNTSLKSKKTRDSGSSKENSIGSDNEEKFPSTPENSKNLLNYFNKVDKLPEIEEKPRKIKVEVLVHADSSGSPPTEVSGKKSNIKKRKSKSRKSVIDFDLITCEDIPEDISTLNDVINSEALNIKESESIANNSKLVSEEVKVDECQKTPRATSKVSKDESEVNTKNSKLRTDEKVKVESDRIPKITSKVKKDGSVTGLNKSKSLTNGNIKLDEVHRTPKTSSKVKKNGLEKINDTKSSKTINKSLKEPDEGDTIVIEDESLAAAKTEPQDQGVREVITIDDDITKAKPKVKHDGTLVSFFNLGNRPPPLPLEKRNAAKMQFLMSGTPPTIKRAIAASSCQGNIAPFPTKSHVQQKEKMNLLWNLQPVKFEFKPASNQSIQPPAWSSFLGNNIAHTSPLKQKIPPFDGKALIKHLKKELNLFPISCWAKELKKMKKGNDGCMWNERYRPHSSSAFLANTRSISKLKAWLTELKESSIAESGASSGDEFVKDNDDEQKFDRKTVVLLSGPPGTGKTASVYAIAEEIGYNVLEINASCNRSGKRILNEFSEAMQSHKVGVSKLQISKIKKKTEEPKRSLILIEDADLLFDDDEGFVPTLINLGASTKRPIILVANNPQAKHFVKLVPLFYSILDYVPPTLDRLGSWLRTLSAVEGFYLGPEDSRKLASSQDLRKCLLQLQLANANMKGTRKENEQELLVWNSASNLDFSSKKGRKKAKRVMTTLAHLDIIRPKKTIREAVPYWHKSLEDSTLNLESQAMPSHSLQDIEASLLGLVSPSASSSAQSHSSNSYFEVPRNLLEVEKDACSLTNILNRRSLTLDYWPVLRQISRSEAIRLASHTKRNNRYFNYLSSLGVKGPPDMYQSISTTFS